MYMRSIFSAPVFADEEKTQYARLFHTIVFSTMLAISIPVTAMLFYMPENALRWLSILSVVIVFNSTLLFLNRRGRTRLASFLLVSMLALLTTSLALTADGVRAPAV